MLPEQVAPSQTLGLISPGAAPNVPDVPLNSPQTVLHAKLVSHQYSTKGRSYVVWDAKSLNVATPEKAAVATVAKHAIDRTTIILETK
jgi:hypothetical protein